MSAAASPDPEDGPPEVEEREDVHDGPPWTGPFFELLGERKRQERDLKIILTAKDGETGIGKSACGTFVAKIGDTSPGGFNAKLKATLDPPEYFDMYGTLELGSAAILDEAEQLDARRSNSHENVDASHVWQQQRVRQIVSILILPSPEEIDSRMERLADVWINVERRGRARVYRKRIHPIKRSVYYETMQTFEFPNMDKDPDYQALSSMKSEMIDNPESDDNWMRKSEHERKKDRAVKQAKREVRDKLLTSLYKDAGIGAPDLASAPAVEITDGRIRQIASERR
ncbi:hypothetical protein SAMN06269185_1060 [Natronoarchaeum philippinense]|uniref:Uncharacterized protein n=1 Tax=Natronoarchaeum philippinense TaxID=558529 RepID=A0A285NEQ6_NATPI|nr:hypothetical protein [Natronoarchaeum philippinense]SNZ06131.1 hypothetical protein SAMN06269185_1060 [Natronoarchaeum philippinense]